MPWKRMLAHITGSVNEDLLRRIEYLLEENRVLRNQIQKRILLTDHERRTLADKAIALEQSPKELKGPCRSSVKKRSLNRLTRRRRLFSLGYTGLSTQGSGHTNGQTRGRFARGWRSGL